MPAMAAIVPVRTLQHEAYAAVRNPLFGRRPVRTVAEGKLPVRLAAYPNQ